MKIEYLLYEDIKTATWWDVYTSKVSKVSTCVSRWLMSLVRDACCGADC